MHNAPTSRSDRAAAAVLALVAIGGFLAILFHLGSFYWFHGDEWAFLTRRQTGSLLAPHNEHITVVPILIYRALFGIWSLSSYTPYQVPVLGMHILTAVLLWRLMRGCAVNAWIATALASVFILFGPGEENIIWAFQIGFTGALALGLAQLALADHDGAIGPRDYAGLALGLAAILSAGYAPVLVATTGAVTLARRGWAPALLHTVPLALVFLGWWLSVGPQTIGDPYGRAADVGAVLHFLCTAYRGVFVGLAGNAVLAAAYVVALAAGLLLACASEPLSGFLRRAVLPLGLAAAGLGLLAVAGYSRWWINDDAGAQSRYLHLGAALTLPALGVALDALTRLWRPSVIPAVLVIVSVIPANIAKFGSQPLFNEKHFQRRKENFVSLAHSPYAQRVPPDTRPDPLQLDVPIGWILERRDEGALPDVKPRRNPADPLLFGLSQRREAGPRRHCATLRGPVDLSLRRGDELGVKVGPWTRPKPGWYVNQSFTVRLLRDGKPVGRPQLRFPGSGELLRVEVDALQVRFAPAGDTEAFILCTAKPLAAYRANPAAD